MGKQYSNDVIRRIIQLRLEALSFSNIAKILGVDRDTSKSAYIKNSNNLEPFRLGRADFSTMESNFPQLHLLFIQYEQGAFLVKEKNPDLNGVPQREKEKENSDYNNFKYGYKRCRQLYLEGIEPDDICQIMKASKDFVEKCLTRNMSIKTKNGSPLKSVTLSTLRKHRLIYNFKDDEKFIYYHRTTRGESKKLHRSLLVRNHYKDFIFPKVD